MHGDFTFDVRINQYNNPTNKLADGSCCDDPFEPCSFFDCTPVYDTLCLRHSGTSTDDWTTCTLGRNENDVSLLPANISIQSSQPWPVSASKVCISVQQHSDMAQVVSCNVVVYYRPVLSPCKCYSEMLIYMLLYNVPSIHL